ncbi:MAG: AbrB/MazE/SpoVT family DNA-binding domain-containing protein [Actinobacteria bacterium]|jgi:AbrB family looped-hinge helix DNA binding protein|nr:MAG: AbrB/MazE/SpoVT family DNA-binding domain-containing protein [Actinomycetota bacterium]
MARQIELTRMSSKGQVVIPKRIRAQLGFEEGDRMTVEAREGEIVLRKLSLEDIVREAEEDWRSKKSVRLYPKSSGK